MGGGGGEGVVVFFFFFLMIRRPPRSTLFPYTTLFRSVLGKVLGVIGNLIKFLAEFPTRIAVKFHAVIVNLSNAFKKMFINLGITIRTQIGRAHV